MFAHMRAPESAGANTSTRIHMCIHIRMRTHVRLCKGTFHSSQSFTSLAFWHHSHWFLVSGTWTQRFRRNRYKHIFFALPTKLDWPYLNTRCSDTWKVLEEARKKLLKESPYRNTAKYILSATQKKARASQQLNESQYFSTRPYAERAVLSKVVRPEACLPIASLPSETCHVLVGRRCIIGLSR